jgi:hypothetical protein
MPELNKISNFSPRRRHHSLEFLLCQHSLFVAGLGQSFFYLHLFKPLLPVWVASPFLLIPWAIVFIFFYHEPPLFPPQTLRRYWLGAVGLSAFFTVAAEVMWILGYLPPPTAEHRLAADVLVQVLMNVGWLSFIPLIRDYHRNPELWP